MQQENLTQLLTPKLTNYIPSDHVPTPKQQAFLLLNCLDAFYGGSAGGGKSDAILMAALQYVDCPKYNALILRRTFTDLDEPGAIMHRAKEWLAGTDARWREHSKTFVFPSGANLTFGYLDGPSDHLKYKGAEFQFIGMDEGGDLRSSQMEYMFSRLRRLKNTTIPIRYRIASNPGGISHAWLFGRYVDPENRGKRVFIQAGLKDNPHLDQELYRTALMELSGIDRMYLLDGNWTITETGNFFNREWFQIVDEAVVPRSHIVRMRYWDLAAIDPLLAKRKGKAPDYTTGVGMVKDKDNYIYIDDIIRVQRTPKAVENLVYQTAQLDGITTKIEMEEEPGASGVANTDRYRRDVVPGFVFKGHQVRESKESFASVFSSYVEGGNVRLVRGAWNKAFLDEAEVFPAGEYDDQIDGASKAFCRLVSSKRTVRAWGRSRANKSLNRRDKLLEKFGKPKRVSSVRRVIR